MLTVVQCVLKVGFKRAPDLIHIEPLKIWLKNLGINEKALLLYALIFLNLGCISVNFELDCYTTALWMVNFAIINIYVFVISIEKM